MEDTASSGRSRRQVTKRVAFSPEPAGASQPKKSAPQPKVSSDNSKRKSDAAEKNVPVSRKSLPATLKVSTPTNDALNQSVTESSSKTIKEIPTPESKGKRLKLKRDTEIPSSSNGIKLTKKVAGKKEEQKEKTGKATEVNVEQPRRGLLALKRYVKPPEEKEIPESLQSSHNSLLTSSSQNHDKSTVEENDLNISVDKEVPINNASSFKSAKEQASNDVENDARTLPVDAKKNALSTKSENRLQEETESEIECIANLTDNDQHAALNVTEVTAESQQVNITGEKPKKASKKVSAPKVPQPEQRPSLPALPTKSPTPGAERTSGRNRKPARSKEYPGHVEITPEGSNISRKRSRLSKSSIPQTSVAVPPPEEKEISESSLQPLENSSLPSSSQIHDKSTVDEKDVDKEVPVEDVLPSKAAEEQASNVVENDAQTLPVDDGALSTKSENQLKEETPAKSKSIANFTDNVQQAALNDAVGTAETDQVNDVAEKPKKVSKKVSAPKVPQPEQRPSLPALPTKSPSPGAERSCGRSRKPAKSKEYHGHEESMPESSNISRKRSRISKSSIPSTSVAVPPPEEKEIPQPSQNSSSQNHDKSTVEEKDLNISVDKEVPINNASSFKATEEQASNDVENDARTLPVDAKKNALSTKSENQLQEETESEIERIANLTDNAQHAALNVTEVTAESQQVNITGEKPKKASKKVSAPKVPQPEQRPSLPALPTKSPTPGAERTSGRNRKPARSKEYPGHVEITPEGSNISRKRSRLSKSSIPQTSVAVPPPEEEEISESSCQPLENSSLPSSQIHDKSTVDEKDVDKEVPVEDVLPSKAAEEQASNVVENDAQTLPVDGKNIAFLRKSDNQFQEETEAETRSIANLTDNDQHAALNVTEVTAESQQVNITGEKPKKASKKVSAPKVPQPEQRPSLPALPTKSPTPGAERTSGRNRKPARSKEYPGHVEITPEGSNISRKRSRLSKSSIPQTSVAVPPPEEEEISESSCQPLENSSLRSSSHNQPDVEMKDLNVSVDKEVPFNNTSSPKAAEVEEPIVANIKNDAQTLSVDEKKNAFSAKSDDQLQEETEAEIESIADLTHNAVLDDTVVTAETDQVNATAEKPKKVLVSPLIISLSKHRPSLPALPTKSPASVAETTSFSGRTRKPARSKEYPGHEESMPESSIVNRKRSRVSKSSIPPTSAASTPIARIPATVQDFMHLLQSTGDWMPSSEPSAALSTPNNGLPERPHRRTSKSILDFAPSLIPKGVKRKSLTTPEEDLHLTPISQNVHDYPEAVPLDIEDEHVVVEEEEEIKVPDNFEIEINTIVQDQVEYLKSLHPHLEKSFEAFENHYDNEYLLREILTDDIINTDDDNVSEEDLDIDGTDEPVANLNYNLTSSTMKYAQAFVRMFPDNIRLSLDDFPDQIEKFFQENDATGVCLKILCEILQKQCCMELAVKSHKHPVASYYVYSLQNATELRSKIFLHFTYQFVQAHEWLIRYLDEKYLASYLMLLKFLQAAGTTLTNILITSANPSVPTNVTVNERIREMLEEKIRDPFNRMLTNPDRQLTNHETFLMLMYPGIKLLNEMTNPVYHAHEQLYIGLTNMGCSIEKIEIKDDGDLPEECTVIDACNYAIDFIKTKIHDAVKRRPNERIFIASWGVTCLFVHEAVSEVDGISGIIDLAMPIKATGGNRGLIGDKMLLTYCPTMVVSGEDSGDVPDTAVMLSNFNISTGHCVVGKADSSLIVEPSLLANYGITQACISRIILNHVMDFIERIVKDTHNKIHTKTMERGYAFTVTEDLNDHVMRDDAAYGVDESFLEDETDPSSIPQESVGTENLRIKDSLSEQDDVEDDDTSLQIIEAEPRTTVVKTEYPGSNERGFVGNSEIDEQRQNYGYGPSASQPVYEQPMNASLERGDVLQEFLDPDVHYVISDMPMDEEAYDEEMEAENQMAAEAIEGGYPSEQNGYE